MIVKPFHHTGPLGRCGVFPVPAASGSGDYLPNGGRGADHCRRTAADWMAAGTGARADAVAARAEILHRAPAAAAAGPNVVHTPGGGPLHTVPSEPAPMRTWNPPVIRSLSKRAAKRAAKYDAETVPTGTVWTMAASAARLSLRGRDWSETDIEDCTGEIVAAVVAAVPVALRNGDRYPARYCGYGWMAQRAVDWRRATETRRRADLEAAADQGARLSGHHHDPDPVDTVDGSPVAARRRAVAMLRTTGVLPDGEPVRWGPAWTAAYVAARSAANVCPITGEPVEVDPAELADELELTPNTLKAHRTRGAAAIARSAGLPVEPVRVPLRYGGKPANGDQCAERIAGPGSRYLWRELLGLPTDDAGRAVKPTKSRSESSSMGDRANGWRGLEAARPAPLPVRCRKGPKRDRRRKLAPPAWAVEVARDRPRAAVRWDRMARVSRERVEGRTDQERQAVRVAAGLPATVR